MGLTNLEIKRLNFIFKKLKGKHEEYLELFYYLKDNLKLSKDLAFELAYLYDINFVEDGDFSSVTNPKRMTYGEYEDTITPEIRALMKLTGDRDLNSYELKDSRFYRSGKMIEYDGTTYYVFSDFDVVVNLAYGRLDWLCDNFDDHLRSYIFMTDTDKRLFADEEADIMIDSLTDEDIIDMTNLQNKNSEIQNKIEELKNKIELFSKMIDRREDKLNFMYRKLEIAEKKFDDTLIKNIEDKIKTLDSEIYNIGGNIGGIEDEIDDLEQEIIDNIHDAKEDLKKARYDEIYSQLDHDCVDYFINNGIYEDIRSLLEYGPVRLDCDQVKKDYIDGIDYIGIASIIGYNWVDEIMKDRITYYIFSE